MCACMQMSVCANAGIGFQAAQGSPDVKWHVNRPAPLVTGWGRKKQTNKNRHTLYKKLRHNYIIEADGSSSTPHPPFIVILSLNCYFFNHVSLFFHFKMSYLENLSRETLRYECSRMTSWAQERLACHIEWEKMPSWLFLQSSLSGSGQFTCLSVCLLPLPLSILILPCLTHCKQCQCSILFICYSKILQNAFCIYYHSYKMTKPFR